VNGKKMPGVARNASSQKNDCWRSVVPPVISLSKKRVRNVRVSVFT
jgi:hypothetical protein